MTPAVSTKQAVSTNNFFTAVRLGIGSMLKHPRLAAIFFATTLIQGALQGLLVWVLRETLVSFTGENHVTSIEMLSSALLIFGLLLLQSGTVFSADVVSTRLAQRVEIESMWQVLAKLLTLPVRFFDKNSQSDLVMSSYYDLKGVRTVTLQVGQILLFLTRLAGLAVVAWLMSPKLAAIGLIAVPIGALPAYWLGQRITKASGKERDILATLYDSFFQVSSGIRIIKVNHGESHISERAHQTGLELYGQIVRQAQTKSFARFLLEATSGIGLILMLVVGGSEVANGSLNWQSLLGLIIAVMAVYDPMVGLLQIYGSIRGLIPNLDRVEHIMSTPSFTEDRPQARPLKQAPDKIELRNVSFGYGEARVLESISANFHHGETIGIVGPSGAGKSTLISVLLRLYDPTEGQILFDGVDLRNIRYADLMENCALVLQEPFLFIDTVANNIRAARPNASMEEVIEAAKAANIHDEIMQMQDGYETVLGRRKDGRGISVGQKQRICIAAALLKNAPILFLDEATSNLDSISERKVQAAIERLMSGRTTFVIAHRLSTLRAADRLLVLDHGKVVGLGTHEELLTDCKTYQRLWAYQLSEEIEQALEQTEEELTAGEETLVTDSVYAE